MASRPILILAAIALTGACDRREPTSPPARTEVDQQVKRLRDDTELELQDLRGRWLAAEGILTELREQLRRLDAEARSALLQRDQRVAALEASLTTVQAELEEARRAIPGPAPADTVLERLARCYEEIACLRKRGAEESVAGVYRRYGFPDVESWAEAWQAASRSEAFEREVQERVERLCP